MGNVSETLRGLDEDEKITLSNPDGNPRRGIPHSYVIINESGLYSLILRSRKPEAKRFKKWQPRDP
jgi:prophage antirepressor-like protein